MAIKRLNIKSKLITLALISSLSINLSGCGKTTLKINSNNIIEGINATTDEDKLINHNIDETNPDLFNNLSLRGDGTTTANLRLRVGPATDYKMLELLNKGTDVEIIGITEDNWYLVEINGALGYVSGSYIEYFPHTRTINGNRVNKYIYCVEDNVSIKQNPDINEGDITKINKGTKLEYLSYLDNGWYLVRLDNMVGYIKEEYLSFKDPFNEYRNDFIKVIYATIDTHLRSEPSSKATSLYEISNKEVCEVLEEENKWYKVRCNNQIGYIPKIFAEDLNGVFIVVDISEQTLTLYDGNNILMEIDITSGTKDEHDTPYGLYSINSKTENATLKGAGYISHVKYWMPFYYGYGLHDASWRKQFGGDIYLKSGSHGCVNIPLERIEEIYDTVQVGTKVLIHK